MVTTHQGSSGQLADTARLGRLGKAHPPGVSLIIRVILRPGRAVGAMIRLTVRLTIWRIYRPGTGVSPII
jgi:hypothetical protein